MIDRGRKLVKKLEKKAANSDARLEDFLSAIQASPNGVVLLDSAGRIEWSNQTASGHLGFEPERDVGQYVRNLVRSPAFVAYLDAGNFGHEIQIDGPGPRPTQPSKISLQVHPYGKKRKLMISRDVTAVQLAEAMRRDFVANVSHEIRTPLTVLSGFVETMQSIELDERGAGALPGTDEPAGPTHADAGERFADAVSSGGQPGAGAGRLGQRR